MRRKSWFVDLLRVHIRLVFLSESLSLRTVKLIRFLELILPWLDQSFKSTLLRHYFRSIIFCLKHFWTSRLSVYGFSVKVCSSNTDCRQYLIVLSSSCTSSVTVLRFNIQSWKSICRQVWAFNASLSFDLVLLLGRKETSVWLRVKCFYFVKPLSGKYI